MLDIEKTVYRYVRSAFEEAHAASAESDQLGRYIAQNRNANQSAQLPGDAGGLLRNEHIRDEVLLENRLHGLNHTCGPLALALHLGQVRLGNASRFQRTGENVCGYDGVLNGVVNADASYGGHRVRRVSDEHEARLRPARAAAGLDREERKLLPVGQGFGVSG